MGSESFCPPGRILILLKWWRITAPWWTYELYRIVQQWRPAGKKAVIQDMGSGRRGSWWWWSYHTFTWTGLLGRWSEITHRVSFIVYIEYSAHSRPVPLCKLRLVHHYIPQSRQQGACLLLNTPQDINIYIIPITVLYHFLQSCLLFKFLQVLAAVS